MNPKKWNIAILGATGAVGAEMLSILEERDFPLHHLHLYASGESEGLSLKFRNKSIRIKQLTEEIINDFKSIDIALLSMGNELSRYYTPLIARHPLDCAGSQLLRY